MIAIERFKYNYRNQGVSGSNRVCESKNKSSGGDWDGRFLFNEEIYKERI